MTPSLLPRLATGEVSRDLAAGNAAIISPCGTYRYKLRRRWSEDGRTMIFIMLNPSTADHMVDDPTIRRCVGFARREQCAALEVYNLFALRATDPICLGQHIDPIGPSNGLALLSAIEDAKAFNWPILCAWGAHKLARRAATRLKSDAMGKVTLLCLGKTADGSPRHPLYVKGDQPLETYP